MDINDMGISNKYIIRVVDCLEIKLMNTSGNN